MTGIVYAIATMDTKGHELAYVASILNGSGVDVVMLDTGTQQPPVVPPDITREQIAACHPAGADQVLGRDDRGVAVTEMAVALSEFLVAEYSAGKVAGVIAIGGSGGTAIAAPAFQRLPVGVPKLIVSTVASGNVAPYIGCTDITLMYSVVDVAGLNAVSKRVLGNAAHAIAGMVRESLEEQDARPTVAMTMFGVTTPCVTRVRERLETAGYDCLVFHATGAGGRAMEKLVASGLVQGVLDITTTEIADEIVGGVFPGGSDRMDAIVASGIPYVVSVGALDMVNFGARETVPERFADRTFHVHNPQVTLMRTTPDENRLFGKWIARKLNESTRPWHVLLPTRGVSMLDAAGQAFFDPTADEALFETLEQSLAVDSNRQVERLDLHINDELFADALVDRFLTLVQRSKDRAR